MQTNNTAYSTYSLDELKKLVFLGKSTINTILLVSLFCSLGFWYVLGLNAVYSTGFMAVIAFSILGIGLCSELVKKVTLSLFRNRAIWLGATIVSIITMAGMLSILDTNKAKSLLENSDDYKTAQVQKKTALNTASHWSFASKYNLDNLNTELVDLSSRREKREISYQSYLTAKQIIKDKIKARQNYESALNTQELANGLVKSSTTGTSTSTNPFLTNVAYTTGFESSLLKMVFYLAVTTLLEWAAWFLGGEVSKIENILRTTKKQRLEQQNKKVFGSTFEAVAETEKTGATALLSNIENTYILFVNGIEKKFEKTAISAQFFINSLMSHLEQNNLLEKYAGVEFRAVNKANKEDFAVYKVNRPTLKNQPKNEPQKIEPNEPKQVQKTVNLEPKQGQKVEGQSEPKPVIEGQGAGTRGQVQGSKRKSSTPDTGTTGDTSHRYNTLKKAIEDGTTKGTIRAIKGFKIDGVGVGDSTAKKFRLALIDDGVIKVK